LTNHRYNTDIFNGFHIYLFLYRWFKCV